MSVLAEEVWGRCAGVAVANSLYVFVESMEGILELIYDTDGAYQEPFCTFSMAEHLM